MTTTTSDLMHATRTRLVMNHPWWGSLALHLQIVADETVETACVNGVQLRYNPTWFGALTTPEQEGVCAHEVAHCALGHIFRMKGRDHETANVAADHVVNLLLKAAGLQLPEPHYADPVYTGRSFEAVYALLQQQKQEQQQKPEKPNQSVQGDAGQPEPTPMPEPNQPDASPTDKADKPGQPGEGTPEKPSQGVQGNDTGSDPTQTPTPGSKTMPCPTVTGKPAGFDPANWGEMEAPPFEPENGSPAASFDQLEADWEKAVETVRLVAQKAGDAPGVVTAAMTAKHNDQREDLTAVLQRYLTARHDYSYAAPDRRLLCHGVRMPGAVKSALDQIVIAVDTSGSVSHSLLEYFRQRINEVLQMDAAPDHLTVVYFDAKVQAVDEVADNQIQFNPVGRGGTRFQPVFDWVEQEQRRPDVLIYLTDLQGDRPHEPEYPVLWVCPVQLQNLVSAKFGEVIFVDPYSN